MRWLSSLVLVALVAGSSLAGGEALSGNWKLTFYSGEEQATFWILQIDGKEGKLSGKAVTINRKVPTGAIDEIKIDGDRFTIGMQLKKGPTVNFDGKLPRPGAKKIFGTLKLGENILPATLEATTATNQFELNKEMVQRSPTDPRVLSAVMDLVRDAKIEKAPEKEVKEWVETAMKTAELFGPRMVQTISEELIDALDKDFPSLALTVAKKIEENLDPKAPIEQQMNVLAMVAGALRKAGKEDDAKALDARIEKLESKAHAEHEKTAISFKVEKLEPRKVRSNRAVLVELFTGAQCPPCVAADLAFDAIGKSASPSEVVRLQYHLHIPGPDVLTNPDALARQKFYDDIVEGTPALILNGKAGPVVGGFKPHAEDRYMELRKAVIELLNKGGAAPDMTVSANRKGDKIDIKASVKDLEGPGEKVKLRLALVENWVRYKGRNGLPYHSSVVRDMPGGAAGVSLTKKDSDHTASADLGEVRAKLTKYLNQFEKEEGPFPDNQRPMRLGSLSVVAFVQNDATREVLQAAEVLVKGE